MALKIDLSKSYDSLEWGFIWDTLVGFNFPMKLINLIMSCITTTSIFTLWDEEITPAFKPSKGYIKETPSPYISLFYAWNVSP